MREAKAFFICLYASYEVSSSPKNVYIFRRLTIFFYPISGHTQRTISIDSVALNTCEILCVFIWKWYLSTFLHIWMWVWIYIQIDMFVCTWTFRIGKFNWILIKPAAIDVRFFCSFYITKTCDYVKVGKFNIIWIK